MSSYTLDGDKELDNNNSFFNSIKVKYSFLFLSFKIYKIIKEDK